MLDTFGTKRLNAPLKPQECLRANKSTEVKWVAPVSLKAERAQIQTDSGKQKLIRHSQTQY